MARARNELRRADSIPRARSTVATAPATAREIDSPAPLRDGNGKHRIGSALRDQRHRLKLTIEEIATAAGLTKGFLSQIERDQASPSVASLVRLCEILHMPIGSLFRSNLPMVVRANEREPFRYGGSNIAYELLTSRHATCLSAIWSDFEPRGNSGPLPHTIQADEEFVLVLLGCLVVEVDGTAHRLEAGDAMTFDPRLPHRYVNPSTEKEAHALCIVSPPPG